MLGSSGYARASQCAICSGDHRSASFASTTARSAGRLASTARLGRFARRHAAASASPARYCTGPPLRATSRAIVVLARPSRAAMWRYDSRAANPRETSSRSAALGAPWARRGGGSRRPPVRSRKRRMPGRCVLKWRAMVRSDSPWRHRAQISSCSAADHPPGACVPMAHLPWHLHLPARWCTDSLRPGPFLARPHGPPVGGPKRRRRAPTTRPVIGVPGHARRDGLWDAPPQRRPRRMPPRRRLPGEHPPQRGVSGSPPGGASTRLSRSPTLLHALRPPGYDPLALPHLLLDGEADVREGAPAATAPPLEFTT